MPTQTDRPPTPAARPPAWAGQCGRLTASQLMSRDVVTVPLDTSIPEAYELLQATGVHHLPVVTPDGRCHAILDAEMLAEAWPPSPAEEHRRRVRDLVPAHPGQSVLAEAKLPAVADLMRATGADAVGVVDRAGRILGLVTSRDLVAALAGPAAIPHQRQGLARPALAVGVMGSASGAIEDGLLARAEAIGRAIAGAGCTLITGACPGLPQAAVEGAKALGGFVVGISPALSETEHIRRFDSPVEGYDILVYTGSGLMGREVINIRSSDMVVILGGHSGTLGEFAIAYDEGRLIGVLAGTGGVAEMIPGLVERIDKETGAKVIYNHDPWALIDELITYYRSTHVRHPHIFDGSPGAEAAAARTVAAD